MLLTNRLFFEQVETMLAEGHDVQIRMKGHSMRPLLRNDRDIAVLTPIAQYASPGEHGGIPGNDGNTPETDSGIQARRVRPPAVAEAGIAALQPGDVVLFRCEGRHILHRIVRIETGARCGGGKPAHSIETELAREVSCPAPGTKTVQPVGEAPVPAPDTKTVLPAGEIPCPAPDTALPAKGGTKATSASDTHRFTLAGDGNYRMEEQCAGDDIVAVMTAVIRPQGRIVRTFSRRWRRQSRCWLALPQGVRRFILRVLWRIGIK